MLKKGQRVKVIDDNEKGYVKEIKGSLVIVLLDNGFDQTYHTGELIADLPLEVEVYKQDRINKEKTDNKSSAHSTKKESREWVVDLHIGHLVDSPGAYTPHEILTLQIEKIHKTLREARIERIEKITFIHGKGKGRLEEELQKILKEKNKIIFFDADYRRYKGGATEIRLL